MGEMVLCCVTEHGRDKLTDLRDISTILRSTVVYGIILYAVLKQYLEPWSPEEPMVLSWDYATLALGGEWDYESEYPSAPRVQQKRIKSRVSLRDPSLQKQGLGDTDKQNKFVNEAMCHSSSDVMKGFKIVYPVPQSTAHEDIF